jgi:hypothetical protein
MKSSASGVHSRAQPFERSSWFPDGIENLIFLSDMNTFMPHRNELSLFCNGRKAKALKTAFSQKMRCQIFHEEADLYRTRLKSSEARAAFAAFFTPKR